MTQDRTVTLRKCVLGEEDTKPFDYDYWLNASSDQKFATAWDLVVQAWKIKGLDLNELRFQ